VQLDVNINLYCKTFTAIYEHCIQRNALTVSRRRNQHCCSQRNRGSILITALLCIEAIHFPALLRHSYIAPPYHPTHGDAFPETVACTQCSNQEFLTWHIPQQCLPQVWRMFTHNLSGSSYISPLDTSIRCVPIHK
jgi:hypothetical protein